MTRATDEQDGGAPSGAPSPRCPACGHVLAHAGGRTPYGWRRVDGRLEADSGEQAVLARIVELRESGLALRAVADVLNTEGLRRPDGTVWRGEQVRRALRAPTV